MQKWEYLIVDVHNSVLPYLGERGWELVTCHPLKALGIDGQHLIFKRPKTQAEK